MLGKISATVLFVQDLERCMKFYRDTLGLKVVFSDDNSFVFHMEGQDFLLLDVSSAVEMITQEAISLRQDTGHRVLLCVGVEDVDASYKALMAKGLTLRQTPRRSGVGTAHDLLCRPRRQSLGALAVDLTCCCRP